MGSEHARCPRIVCDGAGRARHRQFAFDGQETEIHHVESSGKRDRACLFETATSARCEMTPRRITTEDDMRRFWAKVDKHGAIPAHRPDLGCCWLWTGTTRGGYGRFRFPGTRNGRMWGAHRFSFFLAGHQVPRDLQLDHLCKVPACVRPEHLEAVTPRVNTLRSNSPSALNAQKEGCPKCGGEFYSYVSDWRMKRACRACHREWDRRNYRRKQASAPRPRGQAERRRNARVKKI